MKIEGAIEGRGIKVVSGAGVEIEQDDEAEAGKDKATKQSHIIEIALKNHRQFESTVVEVVKISKVEGHQAMMNTVARKNPANTESIALPLRHDTRQTAKRSTRKRLKKASNANETGRRFSLLKMT